MKKNRQKAIAVAISLLTASGAFSDTIVNHSSRPANPPGGTATADDLASMSLEELLNVDVRNPAGLTTMDARRLPVNLTELDSRDVQQSGARDLNHLLEAYVPNVQLINHHWPQAHLGFRGIISDREDKYLYQVNGLTLNNRMLLGADNERALPLLGDIRTVRVVRGPASATHGAGALAGVIDVEAYNGLTFQGADLKLRQGIVDQYTAAEIRYGLRLGNESGLFVYYGAADVQGADSRYYIGQSFPATNDLPANVAGQRSRVPMATAGEAAFDAPWQKAHLSYVNGPLEIWARFVQDGGEARPNRDIYTAVKPAEIPVNEWTRGRQAKNQQFTAAARLKTDLSPSWNLELLQSYDMWLLKDQRAGVSVGKPTRHAYEHQLFSRAIVLWTPNQAHSLALGTEYSHMWFHDPAQSDALDRAPVVVERDWETNTISLLAEHQWRINEHWTTFASFRTDKNTYSDWLISPRGTVVFTPTQLDTFKLMVGQSVRRGADEELWGEWKRNRTIPDPETLLTYEITYERKLTDDWRLSASGFFEDYDAIGWIPSQLRSASVGNFRIAGGELALTYATRSTRLILSESISTLVEASLPDDLPAAGQGITAEPYGFGSELANWAPSITKLTLVHDLSRHWSVSSSVIYYSGFPGGEDYAKYAATLISPPSGVPRSDPGYDTPYGPNLYVNMGLEWRPNDHWTVRLDGYNLAALFDRSLSKRNYILRTSEYSEEPAAVAISITYRF